MHIDDAGFRTRHRPAAGLRTTTARAGVDGGTENGCGTRGDARLQAVAAAGRVDAACQRRGGRTKSLSRVVSVPTPHMPSIDLPRPRSSWPVKCRGRDPRGGGLVSFVAAIDCSSSAAVRMSSSGIAEHGRAGEHVVRPRRGSMWSRQMIGTLFSGWRRSRVDRIVEFALFQRPSGSGGPVRCRRWGGFGTARPVRRCTSSSQLSGVSVSGSSGCPLIWQAAWVHDRGTTRTIS